MDEESRRKIEGDCNNVKRSAKFLLDEETEYEEFY